MMDLYETEGVNARSGFVRIHDLKKYLKRKYGGRGTSCRESYPYRKGTRA